LREFSVSIIGNLQRGLRPDDRVQRNSVFATQCQNIRPIVIDKRPTLSTFTPISDPFASGYLGSLEIGVSHPFPQIFKGRENTFLLSGTKIYKVTEGTDWTLTELETKDAYDVGVDKSIPRGESWHFADFGASYAFFNKECTVFKTNRIKMFGGASDVLVADDITINTGCASRGRLVLGGFNTSDFWRARWDSFLREASDAGLGFVFPTSPGSNFVWWSQIGSGAFFLFYPEDYIVGNVKNAGEEIYSSDVSMLDEMLTRNEMGFMPMHWQGTVRRVLPLGNGVMVYGDNGISYMPKSASTYGLVDLVPHGIASRSSVGGTEREHVFVDESGWLWRATPDEQPKRLGFREFFENMLSNDIVVSYDSVEDEYHISDENSCFVLNRSDELYESTYLPKSIVVSNGGAVGVYSRSGHSDDEYAILESDIVDLGIRTIKTIERVVVSATNTASLGVSIKWRNKSSDAWSQTPFADVNYEGVAYFPVKGLEFKIVIRCKDYTKIDVDDVYLHFKTDDKRIVRGTYALENAARANI